MILILNAGSSSLRFKLFENEESLKEVDSSKIDRIGISGGPENHEEAFEKINSKIESCEKDIKIIGHRVVHGADFFRAPTLIDDSVIENLKKITDLAPLHEPAEIETIVLSRRRFTKTKQYAVFDTSFYRALPEKARLYGLPYKYFKKGIKRFGFHGSSHKYVANRAAKKLESDISDLNLITIHLGAGSSITAIKKGRAIDTSMGFTPLEGLLMGSRAGDIDPGIIINLLKHHDLKIDGLDKLLNKKSGLLGLSGVSSDMLDLLFIAGHPIEDKKYRPPSNLKCGKRHVERAKMAIDVYIYRIQKYIGAYSALLSPPDALVFTGAIGSGSTFIRDKITSGIKATLSGTEILAIKTDEERQIASEIVDLTNG